MIFEIAPRTAVRIVLRKWQAVRFRSRVPRLISTANAASRTPLRYCLDGVPEPARTAEPVTRSAGPHVSPSEGGASRATPSTKQEKSPWQKTPPTVRNPTSSPTAFARPKPASSGPASGLRRSTPTPKASTPTFRCFRSTARSSSCRRRKNRRARKNPLRGSHRRVRRRFAPPAFSDVCVEFHPKLIHFLATFVSHGAPLYSSDIS